MEVMPTEMRKITIVVIQTHSVTVANTTTPKQAIFTSGQNIMTQVQVALSPRILPGIELIGMVIVQVIRLIFGIQVVVF